jgi:hypothetical protein
MDTVTIISWTQIAANVVTAVSVIVLIIQLHSSGVDRRLEAVARSIESYSNVLTTLAQNPQLADVYSRGLKNPRELTPSEEVQFSCFVGQLFWSWEMIFHQSAGGRLLYTIWSAQVSVIDDILTSEGAKEWWCSRKRWYSIQFGDFVDSRIRAKAGVAIHGWSSNNNA